MGMTRATGIAHQPSAEKETTTSAGAGDTDGARRMLGAASGSSSSLAMRRVVNCALCPICAEPVREAFLTPCGHTFCHQCLIRHLRASKRSTCPQCSAYVTADKIVPNMLVSRLLNEVRNTQIPHKGMVTCAISRKGCRGFRGAQIATFKFQ